jgi:hypothetical protein
LLGSGVALLGALAAFALIRKRAEEQTDAAENAAPETSSGPGRKLAGPGAASPQSTERVREPETVGA